MPEQVLKLNDGVVLAKGDTATFDSTDSGTQYHFEVVPNSGNMVIGVWKGVAFAKGNGVARNKPGVNYVDHVCGVGHFVITVESASPVVTLTVKKNSWWKRVFGWG